MNENYGFSNEGEDPNPIDDSVKCCPDCERPNQFGELCESCRFERQIDNDWDVFINDMSHDT